MIFYVTFFGVFFGKVWGNSEKILRTPKNLPAPAHMVLRIIDISTSI